VDALRQRRLHGKRGLEPRARLLRRRHHQHADPVERKQVPPAPRRLHLALHGLDDRVRDLERLASAGGITRAAARSTVRASRASSCRAFARMSMRPLHRQA
jgi:hypothetical protein